MLLFFKATYDEVIADKNKQLDAVQKEIDDTRSQIRDNSGMLSDINKRIDSVEAAVNTLDSFLKDYQDQTYLSAEQIAIETNMVLFLADEVDKIQQSFKNKIVNLYKHGKNYELELLMSSKTPNEYLRRNQYLQKFSLSRKKELRDLKSKKFLLDEKKKLLSLSTSSQRFYIESKRNERTTLAGKLSELKNRKSDIESRNSSNLFKLDRKQQEASGIKSYISNYTSNKSSFNGTKINRVQYPVDGVMANKGNLNPPLDISIIKNEYGEKVNNATGSHLINNGADFNISKGSKVYSVGSGTVSLIGDIPYYGKVIIITHDNNIRTIYACLNEVNVNTGDKVKTNQVIAKSGSNLEGQILHFEIWKDKTPMNPREWIKIL
jgi:septal ring factor EnvC (AmiA/AmiB activator)